MFSDIDKVQHIGGEIAGLRANVGIRESLAGLCETVHPSLDAIADQTVSVLLDEWREKQDKSNFTLLLDLASECRCLAVAKALQVISGGTVQADDRVIVFSGAQDSEVLYDNAVTDVLTVVERFSDLPMLSAARKKVCMAASEVVATCYSACEV